jgi:hypothetical protein
MSNNSENSRKFCFLTNRKKPLCTLTWSDQDINEKERRVWCGFNVGLGSHGLVAVSLEAVVVYVCACFSFMENGGWALVFMWLEKGIDAQNWLFIQEILELLMICPVDVARLKSNNIPKLVKSLSKNNQIGGGKPLKQKTLLLLG